MIYEGLNKAYDLPEKTGGSMPSPLLIECSYPKRRKIVMKRTFCFVIGIVMVSCLMLAGCKKASEKMAEKAIESGLAKDGVKAKVDASGQKITIEDKDGKSVYVAGKSATLPDNFPKDVYVYEGATIMASVSVPEGFNLTLETSDSADKIMGAIKSKMSGLGWKEEMTMNQGKNAMVGYKKEKRTAMYSVNTDKKTMISMTVSTPKSSDNAGK
jgi:hypothetical protein